MANPAATDTSHITIVAPSARVVDLALPSALPLAHVLPRLLDLVGGITPDGVGGWTLARFGQSPLDPDGSLTDHQIRDGELLYLRRREQAGAPAVFDDVVDAIVIAQRDADNWHAQTAKAFAVAFAALALLGGLGGLLAQRITPPLGGVAAGLIAVVLLMSAAVTVRSPGATTVARLLSVAAVLYGGAAGFLAVEDIASPDSASQVLVGATAAAVLAAVTSLAVRSHGAIMLPLGVGAIALAVGVELHILADLSGPTAAAVMLVLGLAALPTLPMLAFRLAGLTVPSVPTGPRDVRNDTEEIDAADATRRSEQAGRLLAGLLAAFALVETGAVVGVVAGGGGYAVALGATVALLLWSRSRVFQLRWQRIPLLCGAFLASAATAVGAAAALPDPAGGAVAAAIVAFVAVAALTYAATPAGQGRSPVWGRTLDLVETTLTVAVVPLAAAIAGVFAGQF
ncbi:type VII secretion integral membrane protein EccD [Catellatospora tritici]|uniref:type VII secretion integral membrane protein EccD n=1 Tax=Catellatospora tritici TaxID=2851566 RepID=UPI001C2D9300|nr:type VII secretion integral membrane protein EccD [Catellatospora tritici]MBV1853550.1 type VII secretion integral membrane protein EccD [Catellatospora tritici]